MRATIRFHDLWLRAMKGVWAEMWKRLISAEDEAPDFPDEYEIEEGPGEVLAFKAEWGDGGSEPVSLDVWISGDKHTAVDFRAECTQMDTMGMVRSIRHVSGRAVRQNDGTYVADVIQEY